MSTHDFTDEQVAAATASTSKKAEEMLGDAEKTNKTLGKAKKMLDKIKKIPVIGSLVDDIATTIELIASYVKGEYKELPFRVIVSAMGGIIYLLSPIDLIPDVIPVLGFVDDAAVLTLIFSTGLSMELKKYRKWKINTERERLVSEAKAQYMAVLAAELERR